MKALYLAALIACSLQAVARGDDSAKARVPEISYSGLDSLIRTNAYTGIYLWPSWCGACRAKLPAVQEFFRQKPGIAFISVNDPDSRPYLPRKLMDAGAMSGYYRIQRKGREKLIAINDHSQFKYFNWYFTKETGRTWPALIEQFLLFDRSGKLVYYTRGEFGIDSVRVALSAYR